MSTMSKAHVNVDLPKRLPKRGGMVYSRSSLCPFDTLYTPKPGSYSRSAWGLCLSERNIDNSWQHVSVTTEQLTCLSLFTARLTLTPTPGSLSDTCLSLHSSTDMPLSLHSSTGLFTARLSEISSQKGICSPLTCLSLCVSV